MIPTMRQISFQDWEFGLFIHFGLRTFYEGHVDFDGKPMTPEAFNPVRLDCKQWIRTAKEAGMNYAVFTAKHHDGFSNWPSQYTTFSVANSPWKDGRGDVVKEFTDACDQYEMKKGLYYSPYDGSVDFYNQDPDSYDEYFLNQMTELLCNYGEIDILWFDTCGSEDHEYDWNRIIGEIRRMQPGILIFNIGDPDFRWVGNEDGIAPIPCWNVVDATDFSVLTDNKVTYGEHRWLPAECDVQLRDTWFYSHYNEQSIKSLDELMGLYYLSVGRGANLLLNIGPDGDGLLPRKDATQLLSFGQEISRRFGDPLADISSFRRVQEVWSFESSEAHLVDHIVMMENLTNGEQITSFTISIITAKSNKEVVIYEGRNVGHKAIVRIPAVKAKGFIIRCEGGEQSDLLDIRLFYTGESKRM